MKLLETVVECGNTISRMDALSHFRWNTLSTSDAFMLEIMKSEHHVFPT